MPPYQFRSPIKCSSKSRRTYHDHDGDHPDDHHEGLERIGPHSSLQPTLETHPNKDIIHPSTSLPSSHPGNTPKQYITHPSTSQPSSRPGNTPKRRHNTPIHITAFIPPWKHTQTNHYTQPPSSHLGNTPKQYITHPSTSQP